ncbi:MAG: hypothetical protein DWQ07_20455 [Chloroflexi bacterium]|nr:MAG: hypothetical protein DWQ07_20455 [Chloroflexota bacterium]MBL1194455.1 hypothetical protein [Chloroflexota bacterium]NOH11742.1 M1 family metallopeptidase [Chloroflexota bacterium]
MKQNLLVLSTLFLVSCSNLPGTTGTVPNTEVPEIPLEIVPTSTEAPTEAPLGTEEIIVTESAPVAERDLYKLDAFLNYETRSVAVEQEITYTNRSAREQMRLFMITEASREANVFNLDFLSIEQSDITSHAVLDGAVPAIRGLFSLQLQVPLQPGETLSIYMVYTLDLPATAGVFGYTARQVNLTDWYPYVAPIAEHGTLYVSPPGPAGEHLVYEAVDFEVVLRLNDPALVVAGPAPAQVMDTGFRYELGAARTFSLSISPEFEVIAQSMAGIPVSAYVFPEHREAGQAAVNTSSRALQVFSELFGPYPYESLAIVEIDYEDGLEADGLFFLGQPFFADYDGTKQNYLTSLSAHEVAHNWWFGQVGNDQANEPFLDEALSTYSEYLFYERAHPELVDWWWEFRINRFEPAGIMGGTIYQYPDFSSYVQAVYFRGASFLHGIRGLMGDEAFLAHLRNYAEQNRHQIATSEDFFRPILEVVSQEEFDQLILQNSELPGGSSGGGLGITITPTITALPMITTTPLPTPVTPTAPPSPVVTLEPIVLNSAEADTPVGDPPVDISVPDTAVFDEDEYMAQLFQESGGDGLAYSVNGSPQLISAFYVEEMVKRGWDWQYTNNGALSLSNDGSPLEHIGMEFVREDNRITIAILGWNIFSQGSESSTASLVWISDTVGSGDLLGFYINFLNMASDGSLGYYDPPASNKSFQSKYVNFSHPADLLAWRNLLYSFETDEAIMSLRGGNYCDRFDEVCFTNFHPIQSSSGFNNAPLVSIRTYKDYPDMALADFADQRWNDLLAKAEQLQDTLTVLGEYDSYPVRIFWEDLAVAGTLSVLSENDTVLSDGTAAIEVRYRWNHHQQSRPVVSRYILFENNGVFIEFRIDMYEDQWPEIQEDADMMISSLEAGSSPVLP